jgi:hypothetical protein
MAGNRVGITSLLVATGLDRITLKRLRAVVTPFLCHLLKQVIDAALNVPRPVVVAFDFTRPKFFVSQDFVTKVV